MGYHGMTALHMAAQAGYHKIVELLIKYGINYDETTEDGTTALFNAVEKGHFKVVKALLESNAEANLSSRDNESPLIQACHRGHSEIVQMLRLIKKEKQMVRLHYLLHVEKVQQNVLITYY